AIPIYTAGSLQESLVQQWLRQSGSRPPLGLMMTHSNSDYRHDVSPASIAELSAYLERELPRRVQAEAKNYSQGAELGINYFEPLDPTRPRARSSFVNIKSIREL